jgi:type III secretion protein C
MRFIICIIFTLILLSSPSVNGANLTWNENLYNHYSEQEDIKDLLTDFFASQNIGVVFSEKVLGKVSGNFENKKPGVFFSEIANAYNLIWYYDGAAVYIYSSHEMTSKVLNLRYLNMPQLKRNLKSLGILNKKYAFRSINKDRIIYISGPERYVELVSNLAIQLDEKAWAMRGENDDVKVFPLKYAWAEDKTLIFHDKKMTVPGVATILRNLLTGNSAPGKVQTNRSEQLSSNLEKLKGEGMARYNVDKNKESTQNKIEGNESDDRDSSENQYYPTFYDKKNDIGIVTADTRQNAVAVRDRKEKMPYYKKIIQLLDVPMDLVEIKATIIDIDRDQIDDLGVEWEFSKETGDGTNIYKGGLNTTDQYNREDGLPLPIGGGLNLATVLGDTANYFLAKVHAMERKGHAKILSRPSVLTLNNIEAQLEHSKTFYVRLEGKEEVDLYDIDTGVVLKVTPHVIEENNTKFVKLAIQIEDGELLSQQVDDIPVVKKSVVNTQAIVSHNESLLLGGYLKETTTETVQTVPCLGSIPILGWLFKTKVTNDEEVERLFLITPTIKPYSSSIKGLKINKGKDADSVLKKYIE